MLSHKFPAISFAFLLATCVLSSTQIFQVASAQEVVASNAASLNAGNILDINSIQIPSHFDVLDPSQVLKRETFWDNQDWRWYQQNIPFFDCPDADITTTYYYRWELLTKHLVYGSPKDGYTFTEFIDRPFWSGQYGAISCPAGHQMYEARWLRSPQVGYDFARYWFRTPGAQPRNYSCWLSDSIWALHNVHPNRKLIGDLLPDMIKNYQGWEKKHFVADKGLFWQNGHDDGMEFNINSRQSQDILRGAPGFRPTLNSYLWADAQAIAQVADMQGDSATASQFKEKAKSIKENMQQSLWDPKRQFFLHRNMNKETRDGFDVAAGSLVYETGKHAGSERGREEIGFVPWQFNLPDKGYEAAWKFLMDENYFAAKYGPRSVELNDPMYYLSPSCCWWSGQSWPYATSQTLKAMANLLHNYDQKFVTRRDYVGLLQIFAKSHRKNGQPYIAEACHPDTGSWEGHDGYNHSEHYFHSSFVDLVLTGLIGIQTSDTERLTIDPLATDWDYFAVDNLRYRQHDISIVWDRTGQKYRAGEGLQVKVNGKVVHTSKDLSRVQIDLPSTVETVDPMDYQVNLAVNNSLGLYPKATASSTAASTAALKAIDGNYWYHQSPPNRWTMALSDTDVHWFEVDFGTPRVIQSVALYWLNDDGESLVRTPTDTSISAWINGAWQRVTDSSIPPNPQGDQANRYQIRTSKTSKIRIDAISAKGQQIGLTEIEAWGPSDQDLSPPSPPEGNLAAMRPGHDFPKASASFTSPYDVVIEAVDGMIGFAPQPRNRWTCYQSPNTEDWFEVDFGKPETFDRVDVGFYDDRGGVQLPKSFTLEAWDGKKWQKLEKLKQSPETIVGNLLIEVRVSPTTASKVRIVMTHQGQARSGLTEFQIWKVK